MLKEDVQSLVNEVEALRGQLGYLDRSQHVCVDGWVCEAHAHLGWPHDSCPGPGMPCQFRKDYESPLGSFHLNIEEG